MQMRTGEAPTGIWVVIWSVEESITATVLENLLTTNKDSALADGPRVQTMSSKGRRHLLKEAQPVNVSWRRSERCRCPFFLRRNATAFALRNIAVMRILVFILEFSFRVVSSGVDRICLH